VSLLEHQANSNAPNLLKQTPLHYAYQMGETLIVQNLIREGP
jgi:ankyrin repeat protein